MSPSIRRTLLLWYAMILIVVIGAFGAFLYYHRQRTVFERIDAEVEAHALALAGTVEWEGDDEGFDLEHTDQCARRFEGEPEGGLTFAVYHPEAGVLARSANSPTWLDHLASGLRAAADRREFAAQGAAGSIVVVGRGTAAAKRELAGFLSAVLLTGAATLALSLLGGWLLVGRLLRPIRRMTATAERISLANLSERIDTGRTETELGRLAGTLNDAFDRIETAFERQTRFTADASHELRTPLSILVSNAEYGLRRDRPAEEYREALGKCLRAGRRMTGVVEGLLVLARADAGELNLDHGDVDLAAVAGETVEFLAPLAEEHGVSLHLDVAPATIRGDGERLRDAVGNLVSNAIRYNREGGRVDVVLAGTADEVVLTVSDTGVGIPADELDSVFERFYRVDKARSREVGGNGLGLAIALWIVTAHGGRIDLTSEVGVGTEVVVRLPDEHCRDG